MRSWLRILVIAMVTIAFAVGVMVHMVLFRDTSVYYLYARSWSRVLLRIAGVKVRSSGFEHLSPTERYVYCANHSSLFDIPVLLATLPDNIRIMYKEELGRIPVFGWCLRMSPFIAVDRGDSREAFAKIEQTVATMSTGASVLVFPEGTRSEDGRLGAFKRGAFSLAARSGRPIVPVTLVGTAAVLPARGTRITPGVVSLTVDAPIILPAEASKADQLQAMQNLHTVLEQRIFAHDHR